MMSSLIPSEKYSEPVANLVEGLDGERSWRFVFREPAEPSYAAVDRVITDNSSAPAARDQVVTRDHTALGARQGHEHLHHARLQSDHVAAGAHFADRWPHCCLP
jgi:hypothetical protein